MKFIFFITSMLCICFLISSCNTVGNYFSSPMAQEELDTVMVLDTTRFRDKATEAKQIAKKNNLDTHFCVLIDMSIHSGLPRWVEWDLSGDSIIQTTLVSHGCGDKRWGSDKSKTSPQFSNEEESHKSSLGRYRIGERGVSSWGIKVKYVLYGLDTTNSNALKRFIVLHSWDAIANEPVYPNGTPEGWGCPAVSNEYLTEFDQRKQKTAKDILMWIYN